MPATVDAPRQAEVIDQPLKLIIPSDITSVETAEQLKLAATPFFDRASPLCVRARQIVVSDPTDKDGMLAARETRLAIRQIRIDADKSRVVLKEESLRKSQAIDRIFNGFRDALAGHESYLLQQEEFAERLEAEKRARLKAERDGTLRGMGVDPAAYNTDQMTPEAFASCIAGIQVAKEAEAARRAKDEEDRQAREQAAAEERERVLIENARLRREAAAADEARRAAEDAARHEREVVEAKARREREARERAEAELRQREKAEADRIAAEKRAAAKAARAPDAQKIRAYAAALRAIPMPSCKDAHAQSVSSFVYGEVDALATRIEKEAADL